MQSNILHKTLERLFLFLTKKVKHTIHMLHLVSFLNFFVIIIRYYAPLKALGPHHPKRMPEPHQYEPFLA